MRGESPVGHEKELREKRASARARLHAKLDQILDQREAIEASAATSEVSVLGGGARAVYSDVADFAAEVAGEVVIWTSLQPYFMGEGAQKNTLVMLRERLGILQRLLCSPGGSEEAKTLDGRGIPVTCLPLDITEIRKQLLSLAEGDITELFKRPEGKSGAKRNKSLLARCQLRALQYDALLKLRGIKAKARHDLIRDAFGIDDWDTIRKWEKSCERNLAPGVARFLLDLASVGVIEGHGPQPDGLGLDAAGEEYRAVARATKEL